MKFPSILLTLLLIVAAVPGLAQDEKPSNPDKPAAPEQPEKPEKPEKPAQPEKPKAPQQAAFKIVGGQGRQLQVIDTTGEVQTYTPGQIPQLNRMQDSASERLAEYRERLRQDVVERRQQQAVEAQQQREIMEQEKAAQQQAAQDRSEFKQEVETDIKSDIVRGNVPTLPANVVNRSRRSADSIAPRATSPRGKNPGIPPHLLDKNPEGSGDN